MKKVKIEAKNKDLIENLLKEVNGKSTEHTYMYFYELQAICESAEKLWIERLNGKKYLKGLKINSTSGIRVASAYKYTRNATRVLLERSAKYWFLVGIKNVSVFAEGGKTIHTCTYDQNIQAMTVLRSKYSVDEKTIPDDE
jgi:hypothetical protein